MIALEPNPVVAYPRTEHLYSLLDWFDVTDKVRDYLMKTTPHVRYVGQGIQKELTVGERTSQP